MRIEELMVGDWVIAPNGKPCKVVSINGVDACVNRHRYYFQTN